MNTTSVGCTLKNAPDEKSGLSIIRNDISEHFGSIPKIFAYSSLHPSNRTDLLQLDRVS